jgi:hypothetical protein
MSEEEGKRGEKRESKPPLFTLLFGGVGGGQSRRVRKGGWCVCVCVCVVLVLFYPQPKRGSIVRGGVREKEVGQVLNTPPPSPGYLTVYVERDSGPPYWLPGPPRDRTESPYPECAGVVVLYQ